MATKSVWKSLAIALLASAGELLLDRRLEASSSGWVLASVASLDLKQVEAAVGLERADELALRGFEGLAFELPVALALDEALEQAAAVLRGLVLGVLLGGGLPRLASESSAVELLLRLLDLRLARS